MAKAIISDCEVCGKTVSSYPSRPKKFCSHQCYWKAQRSGMVKVGHEIKHLYECAQCGIKVNRVPSKKRNGDKADHVFCSRSCYDEFRAQVVQHRGRPCPNCGTISTKSNGVYCSQECRVQHKKPDPVNCINCGTKFTALKAMNRKSGVRLAAVSGSKTCSRSCQLEWIRSNPDRKAKISAAFSGESHPNWQGGSHRMGYRGREWKQIREKVRERAGHECEHCGISEEDHIALFNCTLHVNHKTPIHQFCGNSEQANRTSNLEALCRPCHTKADWKWRKSNASQMYMAGMFRSSR